MVPIEMTEVPASATADCWNTSKSSQAFRDLQRAYLPQPPLQTSKSLSREALLEKRMTERRKNSEESCSTKSAKSMTMTSR